MLLAIDVGNSHTALGLYDGEELRGHWRIRTAPGQTADELRAQLGILLSQDGIAPKSITGACLSSVVPDVNRAWCVFCESMFGLPPLVIGPGVKTGLVLAVENPREVGADRIVDAVGALSTHEPPLIIVDFGTATTFDVIAPPARYLGGAIAPGIQISVDALFERCAKLPRVDIELPPSPIGRNTVEHIRSGLTYGYADMTDGLIGRMTAELEAMGVPGKARVIATGGFAEVMAGVSHRIDEVDPWLTLKGLRIIHARNRKAAP